MTYAAQQQAFRIQAAECAGVDADKAIRGSTSAADIQIIRGDIHNGTPSTRMRRQHRRTRHGQAATGCQHQLTRIDRQTRYGAAIGQCLLFEKCVRVTVQVLRFLCDCSARAHRITRITRCRIQLVGHGAIARNNLRAVRQCYFLLGLHVTVAAHRLYQKRPRQQRVARWQQGVNTSGQTRNARQIHAVAWFDRSTGRSVLRVKRRKRRVHPRQYCITVAAVTARQHIDRTSGRTGDELVGIQIAAAREINFRAILHRHHSRLERNALFRRRGNRQVGIAIQCVQPVLAIGGRTKRHRQTLRRHRGDAVCPQRQGIIGVQNNLPGRGFEHARLDNIRCAQTKLATRRQHRRSATDGLHTQGGRRVIAQRDGIIAECGGVNLARLQTEITR